MPKRTDIQTVLVVGSGPIVIGQGCEFDYSGTQACRVLRREGYRVVLVNSNPVTIMTDPALAHRTYIEPLTATTLTQVIERERPEALLPTLGGQTALNLALELDDLGVLEMHGVELIGANRESIERAEDREKFKHTLEALSIPVARGEVVRSVPDGVRVAERIGYPLILRPSFTLGGTGGGIVRTAEELSDRLAHALNESPVGEVLVEESLIGWKEIEFEVMRDRRDQAVIVAAIENIDPMGIHTGDSITVCPPLTLTDREYQTLRSTSLAVIRAIGVEAGGSNIQFAVNPRSGEFRVIEMNPRVSRSSALASKATGFPIAKIAALLSVGYTLDEIPNDITRVTPSCFEPALDYVVVKIPKFNLEKFPGTDRTLTTQMKSIGEVMAIGGTFKEAFQKAIASLEEERDGLMLPSELTNQCRSPSEWRQAIGAATPDRIWLLAEGIRRGWASIEEISALSGIDPWFLAEFAELVHFESDLMGELSEERIRSAKEMGFADATIARIRGEEVEAVRSARLRFNIRPAYKQIDTAAGEFEARTPYLYSTYSATESDCPIESGTAIAILGSGPNRIGQGIEFDCCSVQGSLYLRERGYATIMINSNPETVSTDYDVSTRLYFEPVTVESVLEIVSRDQPIGVIAQLGGQTPLKMSRELAQRGVKILGTGVEAIELTENRAAFCRVLSDAGISYPKYSVALTSEEAERIARDLEFPIICRPSYVIGGRAMEILWNEAELTEYLKRSEIVFPLAIDQFLDGVKEFDVDVVVDSTGRAAIVGILEHIEEAGIHSGDSQAVIPPVTLSSVQFDQLERLVGRLVQHIPIVGLMNLQLVWRGGEWVLLEVNPRASRTVPFVSKATGVPIVPMALSMMLGGALEQVQDRLRPRIDAVAVKQVVLPFHRFPGADPILGPEMHSTGEVMGLAESFEEAVLKGWLAVGLQIPESGTIFVSVRDTDKARAIDLSRRMLDQGYELIATMGTARALRSAGLPCRRVYKVDEGTPHVLDRLARGEIHLVINTCEGRASIRDSAKIRQASLRHSVPYFTSLSAAELAMRVAKAKGRLRSGPQSVQEWMGLDPGPLKVRFQALNS